MIKEIKKIVSLVVILILASCSSSDGDGDPNGGNPVNSAPTQVSQIIFPTANLLCTDNTITFEWNASTDVDNDPVRYRVVIALDRDLNNVVEERTVSTNSVTLTLLQATAYYWNVTALDNMGAEAEPSQTFAFFTSGPGVINYAPFTAELVAPADAGAVSAGTVNLSWIGADTDAGDTLTYDLYFGDVMDPPLSQSGLTAENEDVTTTAGNTYYWRVDTIDDSNVKTIGQIWSFTAN